MTLSGAEASGPSKLRFFQFKEVYFLCSHHSRRKEVLCSGFMYVALLVHGSNSLGYFFGYMFCLVFLKLIVRISI